MSGWVGVFVFIYVLALLIGSVMGGTSLFAVEGATNPVQGLMTWGEVWSQQSWGVFVYPIFHPQWIGYLWDILLLRLPMFGDASNPLQLVRWLILGPMVATVIVVVILWFLGIFQKTLD